MQLSAKKQRVLVLLLVGMPFLLQAQKGYQLNAQLEIFNFIVVKNLILVEATVDQESGLFLLDTGASHLTLNKQYFKPPKSKTRSGHYSDASQQNNHSTWIKIKNFCWGKLSRKSFYTPMADLSMLEQVLQKELLGLIGVDVIKNFEILIDYNQQYLMLISLDKKGVPLAYGYNNAPDHTFDIDMNGHLPIITASIGPKNKLKLALDTGASINLLNRSLKKKLSKHLRNLRKINIASTSNSLQTVEYAIVDQIMLENEIELEGWTTTFSDIHHLGHQPSGLDGLIGIDIVVNKRLAINFKKKKLYFWN